MGRENLAQDSHWEDTDQLRTSITRQKGCLTARRSGNEVDLHKYFGGWRPVERSNLELIKLDERLKDMMEYETSSASAISKSLSCSVSNESLALPSVADELKSTFPMSK